MQRMSLICKKTLALAVGIWCVGRRLGWVGTNHFDMQAQGTIHFSNFKRYDLVLFDFYSYAQFDDNVLVHGAPHEQLWYKWAVSFQPTSSINEA
jgi:hypothetical protein